MLNNVYRLRVRQKVTFFCRTMCLYVVNVRIIDVEIAHCEINEPEKDRSHPRIQIFQQFRKLKG